MTTKDQFINWISTGNISIPKVLLKNYRKLGLLEEDFMMLLHISSFAEEGNQFPTPDELQSMMSCSTDHCTQILRGLMQKGLILIEEEKDEMGIQIEKYSLRPLWEKLFYFLSQEQKLNEQKQKESSEQDLYTIFEKEFGRPLSPMECESLTMWIDVDEHDAVIIKAALRESVLSGKLNFRYIDRILFEWKKNGIKTVQQAQEYGKKFRSHQKRSQYPSNNDKSSSGNSVTVPFYNWLES